MSNFIRLGVIGHPIDHSKSPLIYNYWIKQYALNGVYDALDIAPENFEVEIRALIERGYSGFNLTVPHKTLALEFCDELDDVARTVGAVNMITVVDGQLIGANTDVFGFIENIKQSEPEFNFTNGPAVVLGAGGASRAVVYGLLQEGVAEIRLLNRTREKAKNIAQMSPDKIMVIDWDNRSAALEQANLLVNTTTLGMAGQSPLDISLSALPQGALVNDIVYSPLETNLLKRAKPRGHLLVTGIGMLLHQARPAFKAWFGVLPEIDDALQEKALA